MSILTQALSHAVVCSMLLGALVKTRAIEYVAILNLPYLMTNICCQMLCSYQTDDNL